MSEYFNTAIEFARNLTNGQYGGYQVLNIGGYAPSSSSTSTQIHPVCASGSNVYTYISTASLLYISSSSASDTHNITYTMLDENYNIVTGSIKLDGQTKTLISSTPFIRILSLVSATQPVGNINVYVDSTVINGNPQIADLKSRIQTPYLKKMDCFYTVPNGYKAMILGYNINTAIASGNAYFMPRVRYFGKDFEVLARVTLGQTTGLYNISRNDFYETKPLILPAKTDVDIAINASGDGKQYCTLSLLLMKD